MSGKPVAAASRATTSAAALANSPPATLKFTEKRELILDGAARLFNRRGIKAGTLAEVAADVGLATNSLTYYYRKKEDLVCACLLRSIAAIDQLIAQAALAPTLAGRVKTFIYGFVGLMADVAEQRRPELIFFGDMRALPRELVEPAFSAYENMYRHLRRLLRPQPATSGPISTIRTTTNTNTTNNAGNTSLQARRALNARTHLLLAQVMWSRAWLTRYEPADYPRAAQAMADILLHGLAGPGQGWASTPPPAPSTPAVADGDDALGDAYLRTATRLINDHGVGGASVERIAAALALTKGSFYHHHDTKHGLVDACFERTFALIRRVQLAALAQPGNGWQRLLAASVPLVALQDPAQAGQPNPLLRLTAWTELPGALRWDKFTSLNRLGERYAALVLDGMLDGSIRLVDPTVAAQLVCGAINALAEIGHWLPVANGGIGSRTITITITEPTIPLVDLFARPLLLGLLAASPADAAPADAAPADAAPADAAPATAAPDHRSPTGES